MRPAASKSRYPIRHVPTILALSIACWLVGCVGDNAAVTVAPSHDELPTIAAAEPSVPITVAVERPAAPAGPRLVPILKEPELTPQEAAAIGQPAVEFKFLPYNELWLQPGAPIGSWWGGVRTAMSGRGGPASIRGAATRGVGVAGWGGPATAAHPLPAQIGGVLPAKPSRYLARPESGVIVGTDPRPSRVGQRKSRLER